MAHRLTVVNGVKRKSLVSQCRRISSYFQPSESEYVNEAVYPPILDLSYEATKDRKIENEAQKITNLPTVEEKLIELNAPKYYGWWACQLKEKVVPYDPLPFCQYATRTCLSNGLPPVYSELEEIASNSVPKIKEKLNELLLQEFEYVEKRTNWHGTPMSSATEEDRFSRNFSPLLNKLLVSLLSPVNQQLGSVEVDLQPRVEAFWSLGGIEPDRMKKKSRENNKKFQQVKVDDPVDRPMQYYGSPCMNLRQKNPLPQFLDRDCDLSVNGDIPSWNLDPRVMGYKYEHRHGTNIPGFWPGTEAQHGFLSILNRGYMKIRDKNLTTIDHQDALHAQAIFHSFAWTLAQACYLGFGPYTELTYPITTQAIITNGQYFSFYAYQLNTSTLYHKHSGAANPHRNVCFTTDEVKLFDVVENGQIKGLNEDVLKTLIKFYLIKVVEPQMELRPFLSQERYIANITDLKKRENIEKSFKHLVSNRPRHVRKEEIYHWEKIYKIDHKTRPVEAKRRFFETGAKDPGYRRLDEFEPKYIPKALQDPPKKSRRGRLPVTPSIKI